MAVATKSAKTPAGGIATGGQWDDEYLHIDADEGQEAGKKIIRSYRRPALYPKQEAALFNDSRYAVCEASTKSGKTVGCMAWIIEKILLEGKPGRNGWWVAPVHPTAKIAYRRLKRALPQALYKANDTDCTLSFPNGAVLWFKSGEKPDNLYGEDVFWCVIDEATRLREEAWHAVRTTLTATRGPIRIIGNVKGKKNWAWKLARKAEAGHPAMTYSKLTWRDAVAAGILSMDEIHDARELLPAAVFGELFDAEAADDAGNPFGLGFIDASVCAYSRKPVLVWGWDLAKSLDWTVGAGLDCDGKVCRYHRWQRPWIETVDRIAKLTGSTFALVDSTGVGDAPVEYLQRPGRASPSSKGPRRRYNFEGFKLNSRTKQNLMEELALGIQGPVLGFHESRIAEELRHFEYEYTRTGVMYSAPVGLHDDCVIALALAWHAYQARHKIRRARAWGR